jgi:tRNA-specific 2-thiouridylase
VAAGERLYVVGIEPDTNRVVLGKAPELPRNEMVMSNPNFISLERLHARMAVRVKIRYRSALVAAVIEPLPDNKVRVVFEHPVPGVCPGQAAVFYDNEVVVGGGTID